MVVVKGLGITGHEVSQEVSTADHSVRAEDKTTGMTSMKTGFSFQISDRAGNGPP